VPLGHGENGKRGRQYARTGKVEEGDLKEETPVVGQVGLVEPVVVQIGPLDDSSFPEPLILLFAAAVTAATAVGRGARSGHVLPC